MTTKLDLGCAIIEELIALQGKTHTQITTGDQFGLPRIISAGDRGSMQISKGMDDLIATLAEVLKANNPALVKTVRGAEWRNLVRGSLGPILAGVDLSRPTADIGPEVIGALEAQLDEFVDGLAKREFVFGASLFANYDVAGFSIGPITIEPVSEWLERKRREGEVSATTARRIRSARAGAKLRKRKHSIDALREDDIRKVVGNSGYVVSVTLTGFASGAGLENAATAARLGLLTVALAWPDAPAVMDGFRLRYDGGVVSQSALTFVPGKIVLSGSKLRGRPAGPRVEPAEWAAFMVKAKDLFDGAALVIEHIVAATPNPARSGVLNAVAQAMLWFYEGCREEADAYAVVHYSACLDALAKGGKFKGICKLLVARLGVKIEDPINPTGPSFKTVVKELYEAGRSRTIHGVSDKLGHDWSQSRRWAEQLAAFALGSCLELIAFDPTVVTADRLKT